jgi:hypothetical protein
MLVSVVALAALACVAAFSDLSELRQYDGEPRPDYDGTASPKSLEILAKQPKRRAR